MVEQHRTARGRSGAPSPYPTRTARRWRTIGAIGLFAVFVPPLLLLVAGSLYEPGLPPPPTPQLFPDDPSTEGYGQAAELGGLVRATWNSLLVAAVTVPLSILVASLAGVALARLPARLTKVVLVGAVISLMVPLTALVVPRFAIFRELGLTDTFGPLIAPALLGASPLYVLAYYLAFRALPADLYDACLVEDVTPWQLWRRVAMPLVRPVTAGLAALAFLLTWSNFLDPLVYLYDRDLFTLPLALRSLATLDPTNFPVFLAGAVLTTVPALIVFGAAQRRFLHDDDLPERSPG